MANPSASSIWSLDHEGRLLALIGGFPPAVPSCEPATEAAMPDPAVVAPRKMVRSPMPLAPYRTISTRTSAAPYSSTQV